MKIIVASVVGFSLFFATAAVQQLVPSPIMPPPAPPSSAEPSLDPWNEPNMVVYPDGSWRRLNGQE